MRRPQKSPPLPYPTLSQSVLVGDVLVEAPAERDVDHLDAAADREERHVVRERPVDEVELEGVAGWGRSEEHTSELQSRSDLVCRLLLEKKKITDVMP